MGGHMLAHKIMRTGYFWLTMETDCCQFVQRCPECQIHGDLIHVPPSELHALTSPWPFSVWGIDIIGKISPKSSNGHEFILVAIDYFTKDTAFGIIDRLRTGRRRMGAVEAANKNIKRYYGGWSRLLGIGQRSSHLHCGLIGLLFVPLQAPHPYSLIPEADWAQARFDQLNLLDERRLRAADHVRAYQRKMACAFKKRVRPRPLRIGDLVLKFIRGLIRDPRGKFRPNWSGPYFIKELTPEGAAWLMDLDGNRFSEPTNVDQLKRGASLEPFDQAQTFWHLDVVIPFLQDTSLWTHGFDSAVEEIYGSSWICTIIITYWMLAETRT
ncbi:hypothetical protein CK203_109813 [Vitis vinifera]|uniref:Integrase zinc-binding domain-containing protein n=1 Tax=Vitis vinifera TaxID=29760 RepID=A0A438CFL1_VITVI|nr:hypothetical protein CK203_109813 [Vitis vinifera]